MSLKAKCITLIACARCDYCFVRPTSGKTICAAFSKAVYELGKSHNPV
jgi:hypothetical protein